MIADDVIRKLTRILLVNSYSSEELGQVRPVEAVEMILLVCDSTHLEVMWRICRMILFRRRVGGVENVSSDSRREFFHQYFQFCHSTFLSLVPFPGECAYFYL